MEKQERPKYDVGAIIRRWGDDFYREHSVVPQVRKVFTSLSECRTSALKGHVDRCDECGHIEVSYNSCGDRHCTKCQQVAREQWIEMRKEEILQGVKYFHVVFTVPHELNPIAMAHQKLFYDCLFKAAWATIRKFSSGENLQPGMTCILHTWGSNMYFHPHLHCIVPGGGVDREGVWHPFRGCEENGFFLFPVRALSVVFRAKMLSALTSALKAVGLTIPQDVRKDCIGKDWDINCKPPARGVDMVLEYIGRYSHRVAISNSRILNVTEDGDVTYDYKVYRSGGVHTTATVSAVQFLNLFSLHILPHGFVRIRHYGLLSPSNRNKLRKVQKQLGQMIVIALNRKKKTRMEIIRERGWDIRTCPCCGGVMTTIDEIPPRSPPPDLSKYRIITTPAICL